MREVLRILQVEDCESDASLILRLFEKAGYDVRAACAQDLDTMRATLAEDDWDVVIADYYLPQFSAPAALRLLQETGSDIPLIVVSGAIGEEIAVEMMRSGAQDYLLKSNLARLVPAVEREVREVRTRRRRNEAERALHELEERFRVVQELSPDGFTIFRPVRDGSGHVVDFLWVYENAAIARQNGTDPQAVVGRRLLDVLPSRRDSLILQTYREVAETGEQRVFEAEDLGDAAAPPAWFRLVVVPMGGDIAIFAENITERKRAEIALRESEERLRLTLDAARVGTFEFLPQTGELLWDQPNKAVWGLRPDEQLSYSEALQRIHPDDRPQAEAAVAAALQPGSDGVFDLEYRIVWPDGSVHWTVAKGKVYFEGEGDRRRAARMVGVQIDVTAQKLTEQALRESEQRYRGLFESIQEAFAVGEVIVDASGRPADWRYLEVNPAFESMLGLKHDDVVGRTFNELFPDAPRDYWIAGLGEVALSGKPARLDHFNPAEARHYEAIAYCPRPGLFAAIFIDATERRRSEERSRETQKLETLGVLAGGIAHDFNNLLTVIMGSAGAALEQCPSCEHSQAVLSAAERAAFLTKQLLAYAGKGPNLIQLLDLSEVVAASGRLLSASVPQRAHLLFDLAKNLPCLESDPTQLEQIAVNLVMNAGEAIPVRTEGRIIIATSRLNLTPETAPRYSAGWNVAPGPYVCLEVRDNGSGMDEDTLSRIFDPFFSTKFTGRGLGLAAVHGIVRTAKGFIDVRSAPGQGTTFRVFFPASAKKRQPEIAPRPKQTAGRRPASVLVVDDEEMVRNLACLMLRRHGYETLQAENGLHALEVINESPAPPSLVLLDLAMPVMGGDRLVPILARDHPDLKIVVSSGYPEEDARKSFPRESVAGFLQKPYTAIALAEKVRELIGEPPKSR